MLNLKNVSLGLIIIATLALSLLAYTSPGKKLTRALFRGSDVRLQTMHTCPEQFERLSNFSNEIKSFHLAGLTNDIDSLLSKSDDLRLAETIGRHKSELADLEAPLSDEEIIYHEVRVKRISEKRQPLRKKYYTDLKTAFPHLMKTCHESLRNNIRDCSVRFPTNFSAQADCETFYTRRVFWEMFKKTPFFSKLSSLQHQTLQQTYEQSFDDALKKQVLTKEPY